MLNDPKLKLHSLDLPRLFWHQYLFAKLLSANFCKDLEESYKTWPAIIKRGLGKRNGLKGCGMSKSLFHLFKLSVCFIWSGKSVQGDNKLLIDVSFNPFNICNLLCKWSSYRALFNASSAAFMFQQLVPAWRRLTKIDFHMMTEQVSQESRTETNLSLKLLT